MNSNINNKINKKIKKKINNKIKKKILMKLAYRHYNIFYLILEMNIKKIMSSG